MTKWITKNKKFVYLRSYVHRRKSYVWSQYGWIYSYEMCAHLETVDTPDIMKTDDLLLRLVLNILNFPYLSILWKKMRQVLGGHERIIHNDVENPLFMEKRKHRCIDLRSTARITIILQHHYGNTNPNYQTFVKMKFSFTVDWWVYLWQVKLNWQQSFQVNRWSQINNTQN